LRASSSVSRSTEGFSTIGLPHVWNARRPETVVSGRPLYWHSG
jgi:hypothetical protein